MYLIVVITNVSNCKCSKKCIMQDISFLFPSSNCNLKYCHGWEKSIPWKEEKKNFWIKIKYFLLISALHSFSIKGCRFKQRKHDLSFIKQKDFGMNASTLRHFYWHHSGFYFSCYMSLACRNSYELFKIQTKWFQNNHHVSWHHV